ncbi:hypothetical protein ACFQX6_20215 [Streptosporangium lutulentum]
MTGVLEERAAIELQIAGRTVCGQLKEAAESDPDAPAYSDPVEGAGAPSPTPRPGSGSWRSPPGSSPWDWSRARRSR